IISIGDYGGQSQQFAVKGNAPDPAKVSQGEVVKYELVEIGHIRTSTNREWDRTHPYKDIKGHPGSVVKGTVLAELTAKRKLKFQVFPGKPAAEVTGFTDS